MKKKEPEGGEDSEIPSGLYKRVLCGDNKNYTD
jgi:hypothetical protein